MKKCLAFLIILTFSQPYLFCDKVLQRSIQKEADHFLVRGDRWILKSWASRSHTLEYVKRIKAVEDHLIGHFQLEQGKGNPLPIYILKDEQSFLNHAQGEDLIEVQFMGGYYSPGRNEVATWEKRDIEDTLKILTHELTHPFLNNTYGSPPMWFSEGFCDYIASGIFAWGKWKEEDPNSGYVEKVLRAARAGALYPLRDLVSQSQYLQGQARPLQYAESWALVYFLLHGSKGKYAPRFYQYLAELRKNPKTPMEKFIDLDEISKLWINELEVIQKKSVKGLSRMTSTPSTD